MGVHTVYYRAIFFTLLTLFLTATTRADDWPGWRGAARDAVCREAGLLRQWPEGGPPLLWTATGLGEGYSGPAIVGNVLYTMGNRGGREWVMALDVEGQGRRLWATDIGPVEYDGYSPGTRCTPTVDGDRLYVLGASGTLACLDLKRGTIRWSKSLVADLGGAVPKWGYAESVLIDGTRLLCTPGGDRATIAALDKMTGRTLWTSPIGDPASYASIIKVSCHGVAQYVQFTGNGVVGVDAADGKLLWRYDESAYTKYGGINIATPVWADDTVFAAAGYEVGGGLARIEKTPDGFRAGGVYFTKEMKNHHGGLIRFGEVLYGCNDPGILTCLEYKTGKIRWRSRAPGKCSILMAEGMLYCRSENGPISLVEADAEEFVLHGQFDQPNRSDQKAWPHLVISGGRLYVRDQDVLLCYDVRRR